MSAGVGRGLDRRAVSTRGVVVLAAVLFGSLSAWALPAKGSPAPPLEFTHLLQAPAGARTSWSALRGKVVVLEFWATTCEWCVVDLPHLNKLAASVDPAKFQFISVNDREDPKVVQGFLDKRKMAGWVGIDRTGKVFIHYGVKLMPTTVIVDSKGRIVAATSPEDIDAADLMAVAAGKTVKFKPVSDADVSPVAASPLATVRPLYEVSLSKASSNSRRDGTMSAGPGRMDMYRWNAETLLRGAYNYIPKDRLVLMNPLPTGLYNLHAVWTSTGDNDSSLMTSFLQTAVALGLNLQVQSRIVTKNVYVLKATQTSKKLPTPTAVTNGSRLARYSNGKLQLINGSMDNLASALESAFEVPVVNETGIQGKFDEELDFPAKDANAARAALLKVLGLELVKENRPIVMLEVESREGVKKAAKSTPDPTPKK
jgi:uncharacterized protein (TIGR03435 family)